MWQVDGGQDAVLLPAQARRFVAALGFGSPEQWQIAIAVSEAASNLVKHAAGGSLTLRWDEAQAAVVLETLDLGPGFAEIGRACRDHVSEGVDLLNDWSHRHRRGLGTGLGAIGRLMDELELSNRPEGGARLVALKRRGRGR